MLQMMKWLPLEEACVRIEEGPCTRSGSELLHCKSSKYRISISSQIITRFYVCFKVGKYNAYKHRLSGCPYEQMSICNDK